MKKSILLLVFCLLVSILKAQVPQGINYQVVIRDAEGIALKNQPVVVSISILKGGIADSVVYTEEHSETTNSFGLVNVVIGKGTTTDDFLSIKWTDDSYFIQTSVDGNIMGAQQFMSVPYAFHSITSEISETSSETDKNVNDLAYRVFELEYITGKDSISDYDGNYYKIVKIGNQYWTGSNLKTTTYNDGTPINNVTESVEWLNFKNGAYCWYDNDSTSYNSLYGILYNYHALETQKLCPVGWHVSNDTDWNILESFIINDMGTDSNFVVPIALKATSGWNNYNGTDNYGFAALPGGYRDDDGSFIMLGENGTWWSISYSNIILIIIIILIGEEFYLIIQFLKDGILINEGFMSAV